MPITKPKTPKPTKKPAQIGGGDYSKILNPVTGKHVQSGGAVGKKLIKNYRYGTIVNPATGKAVKTGGKIGGEVLKRYMRKVGGTPINLQIENLEKEIEYKKRVMSTKDTDFQKRQLQGEINTLESKLADLEYIQYVNNSGIH